MRTLESEIRRDPADPRSALEQMTDRAWSPKIPRRRDNAPTVTTTQAIAEINHGRWIVRCPWCPGAQFASATDHQFCCVDCGNAAVDGAWIGVRWPRNREAIELVLARRPIPNQNFDPRVDTLKTIGAENVLHGVAG